jgi:hypothetical protein
MEEQGMHGDFCLTCKPFLIIAFLGNLAGCCFFLYAAVKLGAMARVYGTGERAKRMGLRAMNWATITGIVVGIAAAYIAATTDLLACMGWKAYLWVVVGSASCGFITASAVTRVFPLPKGKDCQQPNSDRN